jgi:hypothetical protein
MGDPFNMHDPTRRAERYRKVAAEYDDLADLADCAAWVIDFMVPSDGANLVAP